MEYEYCDYNVLHEYNSAGRQDSLPRLSPRKSRCGYEEGQEHRESQEHKPRGDSVTQTVILQEEYEIRDRAHRGELARYTGSEG